MTSTERICTHCEGSGETVHPQDKHMNPEDPNRRLQDCRKCQGTGYVGDRP